MTVIGLILLGFVAGSEAAILGIGGGILYVPALASLFDFAQKKAQGTSLAAIVAAAAVATVTHARYGRVDWPVAIRVVVGAIAGAGGGALVAQELDDQLLRRLFAIFLVAVALRLMTRTRSATNGDVDSAGPRELA